MSEYRLPLIAAAIGASIIHSLIVISCSVPACLHLQLHLHLASHFPSAALEQNSTTRTRETDETAEMSARVSVTGFEFGFEESSGRTGRRGESRSRSRLSSSGESAQKFKAHTYL